MCETEVHHQRYRSPHFRELVSQLDVPNIPVGHPIDKKELDVPNIPVGHPIDCYQLSIRMLIDKPFSRVLVTIQLLTERKPISYIFPIRTTVRIGQRTRG